MPVPNTFGTATSAIPLSQLDANFATPITIGNTAVQLGNTVTTLNNMTLANVTISSGTITITNVAVTTANVSGTANISTLVVVGNATVGGNTTITGNITAANANVTTNLVLSNGTANGVAYLNVAKVLTTGSALVFDGTNLGIGVSPAQTLHVKTSTAGTPITLGVLSDATNLAALSFNGAYASSTMSGTYYSSGGLNYTVPSGSTHNFRVADAIKMVLDASGNLGIGTTSPATRLDVSQANAKSATGVWQTQIFDSTSQTTGVGGGISLGGYKTAQSSAEIFAAIDAYKENSTAGNAAGALRFHTQVSSGSGLVEAGRFDSSGNLLVGTTSTNSSRLNAIKGDATGPVIRAESSSGSFTGSLFEGYGGRTTTNGSYNLISVLNGDASGVFKVLDSGNAQNTNNSYGPIASDPRLKENITYDVNYLEDLMRLKVCKFSFKKAALDKPNQLGFLTDNIKEVFPKLIEKSGKAEDFGLPAGEPDVETYKSSVLLPIAIRAIQEQQALIVSMRDELDALKTKVGA